MQHYPIFLDLKGQKVLVIGAGDAAERKIRLLQKASATICVVADDVSEEIEDKILRGAVHHMGARFGVTQFAGVRLVIIADAEEALARRVYFAAKTAGLPVNAVDRPDLSTCITPAIIDRDPITVAVSSAGTAPMLARKVRAEIEALLPANMGRLASWSGRQRQKVMETLSNGKQRLRFWERFFDSAAATMAANGQSDNAQHAFDAMLGDAAATEPHGEVYIVGAGPGDPDLLTVKAVRLMQKADVVLYDSLVSEEILDLVRRDADRILVGKRCDNHTLPQEEMNALLVKLAGEGKRVLRLKAGDPYVFGRGGEEVEELSAAGVRFEVVPGITAASGCATYAGIPLTHRDHAQSCVYVTGHGKGGKPDLDWQALAQKNQTIAIYMGLKNLKFLSQQLRLNGMRADMPAAVVVNGTRCDQQKVVGTLATLSDQIKKSDVGGPALVIVGSVVSLADTCNWFTPDAEVEMQQRAVAVTG
jgi:uroporphyrin-III C-methyltransferase/precorrin-2 dehydrogenase/sirohydrochlorin ferrochelatase